MRYATDCVRASSINVIETEGLVMDDYKTMNACWITGKSSSSLSPSYKASVWDNIVESCEMLLLCYISPDRSEMY